MILIEPIRNNKPVKDGAYILAIQVWALNNLKLDNQTFVFPFICDPHIQFGYFQNPEVEVNFDYLNKHNIPIVRRDTGGGAILIDDNSANFCFLIPATNENSSISDDYAKFYAPIIEILKSMGAKNITQSGKNDLTIDNKKVSGAAMLKINNVIYGGFSLLYNINYDAMEQALKPSRLKIASKGIKSIRQRVAPLKDFLDPQYQNLTIWEFQKEILKRLLKVNDLSQAKRYVLSEEEWKQIDQMVNDKYKNWDWVYGLTPRYEYNREGRYEKLGTINVSLVIEQSCISKCKITGDFFVLPQIFELEKGLVGTKMIKKDLIHRLKELDFDKYFVHKISVEDFVKLILS